VAFSEHGRDQFADSRMNVRGALRHRVWRFGAHHIEDGEKEEVRSLRGVTLSFVSASIKIFMNSSVSPFELFK
jgi:hypothetical protein